MKNLFFKMFPTLIIAVCMSFIIIAEIVVWQEGLSAVLPLLAAAGVLVGIWYPLYQKWDNWEGDLDGTQSLERSKAAAL